MVFNKNSAVKSWNAKLKQTPVVSVSLNNRKTVQKIKDSRTKPTEIHVGAGMYYALTAGKELTNVSTPANRLPLAKGDLVLATNGANMIRCEVTAVLSGNAVSLCAERW